MKRVLVMFCAAFFAAGCSVVGQKMSDVRADGEGRLAAARALVSPEPEYSNIRFNDGFFVPELKPMDAARPSWYFERESGTFNDMTLETAMREVLASRGINVRFLDGVDRSIKFSLAHTGTVGELLEKISFATKYSFTLDRDMLSWSRFETAELPLAFLAGSTNYFFGSKEGQGPNLGNSGVNDQVVVDTNYSNNDEYVSFSTQDLDVWREVEETIRMFMSGSEGANVRLNQASSTVVIRDYPDNVAQIRRYIESMNQRLTRLVVVDIQIVEFSSREGENRALNWDVIKQDLASGGIINFSSAFSSLSNDNLAPSVLGWTQETGKYAGSSALINALNTYGVQTRTTSRRITGLNNQVTRIQNGGEFFFLARSGGTSTPNVGSEDSLTPGVLKLGDTMYMLPNAVGDEIVVQLSTRMASLRQENPRRVTSGSKSIEAPETISDELFLKFSVRDGETLLVSASSEDSVDFQQNSTLGSMLLGGQKGSSNTRRERLVLITPRIVGRG